MIISKKKTFAKIIILIINQKLSNLSNEDKSKIVLDNVTIENVVSQLETEYIFHRSVTAEISNSQSNTFIYLQDLYIFNESDISNYKMRTKVKETINKIFLKKNFTKLVDLRNLFKGESDKKAKTTYNIYT